MKRPLIAMSAILALLLARPVLAIENGQQAPDFELPGRSGTLRLADFKGKTVYLDFWASWCGPCRQSFPWMNQMQARYADRGLRVVSINLDQKNEAARSFLQRNPATFDIAFDPAGINPKAYAIKAMPTSVLIGADGKVLMVHSGFRDDESAELERRIRQAMNLKEGGP